MKVRNIIISDDNEITLVYCLTLTIDEVTRYAKYCGLDVDDVYEVKPEELQYYCIDGRAWLDTEQKEEKVRTILSKVA